MAADIRAARPEIRVALVREHERIGTFIVAAGDTVLWDMDETGTFPAASQILQRLPSPRRGEGQGGGT